MESEREPSFSIVIATCDRPRQLAECLAALTGLDYPRDRFEVVVVDDGSRMALDAVVAPYRDRLDVTLLSQANAGPAAARNSGAARAKGAFLAFTDDDCAPSPDWLGAFAARVRTAPGGMIGGHTINGLPRNAFSTTSQLLVDYLYDYYNADPAGARFFASNNMALPADRFRAIGGFDTRYIRAAAEDRELCDRWLQMGYSMVHAPEAVVYHRHRLGPRSFWRQHYNYGRGAPAYHRARAARGQRFKIEPLPFYVRLLRFPWTRTRGRRALGLALLLVITQVANTAGFLAAWVRPDADRRAKAVASPTSEAGQ